MKILLIADGRSPITRRYIEVLDQLKNDVFLISSFPCSIVDGISGMEIINLAFGSAGGSQVRSRQKELGLKKFLRQSISRFRNIYMKVRYIFGPFSLFQKKNQYQRILNEQKPDVVHALRIPFEGMLASFTPQEVPVVVSIWGNDLSLHANGSLGMKAMTKRSLIRANGLVSDAASDIQESFKWGFKKSKPSLVIPGSGGIDLLKLDKSVQKKGTDESSAYPDDAILIINPRGFRPGSVRNDTFFKSIPTVVKNNPDVHFLCPAMLGQTEAKKWIDRLGIGEYVTLLPFLDQHDLWKLFKKARISISVSEHDGVPNSLLEAMAIGCFPIVGNIASVREWVEDGKNGYIVDPGEADELSQAINMAITSKELREEAAAHNRQLICSRAEVSKIRDRLQDFYLHFV